MRGDATASTGAACRIDTARQLHSRASYALQVQLDREWYDQEEGGAQVDETHNPFLGDEALFAKKEAEMQQKMKRRDGSNMTLAQSKRANELQKDMNAWEENRMLTSGVVRMREVSKVIPATPVPADLLTSAQWFLLSTHGICAAVSTACCFVNLVRH